MQATRYRLRFITGVSLTSSTYGSGTYGSGTYGEQASDPLNSLHYVLIPLPAGYLTSPSWIYAPGDTGSVFRAQVISDNGPLDLEAVADAQLVLTPLDGRALSPFVYHVDQLDDGIIERTWQVGDLIAGIYRAAVVFIFDSGRQLSVPTADDLELIVTP